MIVSSWINRFRNRLRSQSRRSRRDVEQLESRTLLTVSGVLLGTELTVFVDDGADVVISRDATTGDVQVLSGGVPASTVPSVQSTAITQLTVRAGDDANVIDLTGVTSADFTGLATNGSIIVEGGDGNDTVTGSADFGESLQGNDGNDVIDGLDGNDIIDGGDGNDSLLGNDGDDTLIGDDGDDTIDGGLGNDSIDGNDGADVITGGAGMDTVEAGNGNDNIDGGDDNDTINGMSGNDTILGGLGDDSVFAGSGNDSVDGQDGDDTLDGQGGNDTLIGSDGADSLRGGSSNDLADGGMGNDTINGQGGRDTLNGGTENDTLFGGGGNDRLLPGEGDDVARGQGGDDTILGGGGADTLDGGSGDDFVSSFVGEETGGAGSATVNIADITVDESNNGATTADFTIALSNVSGGTVTIDFATQDGTAVAGSDYVSFAGSVIFLAGEVQKMVSVPILDDLTVEMDETFSITLSSSTTALAGTTTATATIVDDDTMGGPIAVPLSITEPVEQAPAPVASTAPPSNGLTVLDPLGVPLELVSYPAHGIRLMPEGGPDGDHDHDEFHLAPFQAGGRWTTTATDGGGIAIGDPITLTWGLVPDGVSIPSFGLGNTANSDLIARLDAIYAETATGPDITNRTWFALFDSIFDRFTELSGVTYVYEPLDDSAAFGGSAGSLGVRPDVRIGGRNLDGDGGVLAFNFFPNGGDMVIDTNDDVYTNLTNNSRTLRNILAHEQGHGLGYDHTEPVDGTKLLEPFLNTSFDGLQFDDILGLQRQYGDFNEGGMSNDTSANATAIGNVSFGQTQSIGTDATDTSVDFTDVDFVSIDGSTDTDVYRFGVAAGGTVDITLAPLGPTYLEGPQGGTPTTFDSSMQNDLSFEVLDTDGSTVLATASAAGLGAAETVTGLSLPASGGYFVRVLGSVDAVQFYQLDVTAIAPTGPAPPTGLVNDSVGDSLTGGNGNDTVIGSNGNDTIIGSDSNDSIQGFAGDDSIEGGAGNDTINSGAGNDTINGGAGNDIINGSTGDDLVIWNGVGNGVDVIEESLGTQSLQVQGDSAVNNFVINSVPSNFSDDIVLQVVEGSASITTSPTVGEVTVNGGGGNDSITVNSLVEVRPTYLLINGESDDDTISAANVSIGRIFLEMRGGEGNDTITGSDSNDDIFGDAGDDSISAGAGEDSVDGGAGLDTINGGNGNDSLFGNLDNDVITGGDGNDTVDGGFGHDNINGQNGTDTIDGGFGNDTLNGAAGNDLVEGGPDNDRVLGGAGNDSLDGGTGNDTVQGQSGADLIKGGDGNDSIQGQNGNDTIDGGDGEDTINAGNGNDIVAGGDGHDSVNGMSGRDTILGGDGNDTLIGGGGVDRIYGQDGVDNLRGNGSIDRFNSGEGGQTPQDLQAGEIDDQNLAIQSSVLEALALLNGF